MDWLQVDVGYALIRFDLRVRSLCGAEEGGFDEQYAGRHNLLKLEGHSSGSGDLHDAAGFRVPHSLPTYCNFLFYRMWHWDP